jgi:hypothetical protein
VKALAVAATLLAACTFQQQVLDDPEGVVTNCDEAWLGFEAAPCAFDTLCERPSPIDPACCTDYAYCTEDGLFFAESCADSCGCRSDLECNYGEAICESTLCEPCPDTTLCERCPDGWLPLLRNGCPTCACAPPSECELDDPGQPCDPDGNTGEVCYAGSRCADGCDASQAGCCANACSVPGCEGSAPMGCLMDCDPGQGCGLCAADYCECDGVTWSCIPVCVEELQVTCQFP